MLNLKKLTVTSLDGIEAEQEFHKELGNALFFKARNLEEDSLARLIYSEGVIPNTVENRAIVTEITATSFPYFVTVALKNRLDESKD